MAVWPFSSPNGMSEIIEDDFLSLSNFKKKLKGLGHFPTIYADISDLKYQFDQQLIKLNPHFED